MVNKDIFVIQPYEVGQRDRKSTALIIPAAIVKRSHIDKNSILILEQENDRKINIAIVTDVERIIQKNMVPVEC